MTITSVTLEGLQTLESPETRGLLLLKVTYNGEIYNWKMYIPPERMGDIGQYIIEITPDIDKQITIREEEWKNLVPKEKEILDPLTKEITLIPITKEEIVIPYIPDYYAIRREQYPDIGDQLDALWKGSSAQEYIDMKNAIEIVKNTYIKI